MFLVRVDRVVKLRVLPADGFLPFRLRITTSRDLADRLAGWRDGGATTLAFAIGGAEGLGPRVIESADAVMSLGAMTWPHFLVRGMLLEQLYRAQQILAGHPYHRE